MESRDELLAWKVKLETHGFSVLQVRHEIIESIYVTDPNGYMVEISWQIRLMSAHDGRDAELTLQAAITLEEERGERLTRIEDAWRRKAELVGSTQLAKEGLAKDGRGVVAVFVLDVLEFRPLADTARTNPAYRVTEAGQGYLRIESDGELAFARKALGFKPAIWYGAFTGGVEGRIAEFSRDHARLVPDGDADGSGVGSAELASPP